MDKLKNPDLAALVAVGLALLVELASYIETHESALELLPAWVGPVLLGGAALARFVLSSRQSTKAKSDDGAHWSDTLAAAVEQPENQVDTEDGEEPSP